MNVAPEITAFLTGLDRLWLPAVDALIKVTLVLGLAGIATVVLGRSSAAVRHLVWTLALSSALMLPVLSIALPRWQLPIVTLQSSVSPTQASAPSRRRRTRLRASPEASRAAGRPWRAPRARAGSAGRVACPAIDSANRRGRSDTARLVLHLLIDDGARGDLDGGSPCCCRTTGGGTCRGRVDVTTNRARG